MDRTENPTPWPKGVSGTPGGRPKRKLISTAYEAAITNPLPEYLRRFKIGRNEIELPEGATSADLIAVGQCAAAAKGNTAAAASAGRLNDDYLAPEWQAVATCANAFDSRSACSREVT